MESLLKIAIAANETEKRRIITNIQITKKKIATFLINGLKIGLKNLKITLAPKTQKLRFLVLLIPLLLIMIIMIIYNW